MALATIKDGNLVLTIPLEKNPSGSKSGKTITIATTHGFTDAGVQHAGKTVKVNVHAFYKPE